MTPEFALLNGRIRTLDPERPFATAIAIAGGELLHVGSDDEVRVLCGAATRIVDLHGAAAVPGLTDSHFHPLRGALTGRGADLMGAATLEEVRRRLSAEDARLPAGDWLLGYGLDYNVFAQSGIDGALVAGAAGGRRALLMFVDMHTGLATPAALAAAGIDGPRDGANVVLDAHGRPTGELREFPAVDLVRAAQPPLDRAAHLAIYADGLRGYAAAGLTAVHGMDGDLETLDVLRELESRGDLAVRVITPFWIKPETSEAEWEAFAAQRDASGRRWRAGVAKFFLDGVIDAGTAWLFDSDSEGEGLAPWWPEPARYRAAVRFFAARGFQCVTHACGDRAVREALDAYRDAGASPGIRHRIEHIETLQTDDVPRFAAENVIASMQAQHMMDLDPARTDNWSRRLGPERCERAFPTRTLLASGATVPLGSDWPVARFDPREGIAAARLRRPPGATDRAPYDDEALSALDALAGYTTAAAAAVGEDARRGRLRAGLAADVTVFERDPVDCPADELPANAVLMTVVDGEIVHEARGAA